MLTVQKLGFAEGFALLFPQPQGENGSEAAHGVRLGAAHAHPQREPEGEGGPQHRGSLWTQTVFWKSRLVCL